MSYRIVSCVSYIDEQNCKEGNIGGKLLEDGRRGYSTSYDMGRSGFCSSPLDTVKDICKELKVDFATDSFYCDNGWIHLRFLCPTIDGGKPTEKQMKEYREGKRNLFAHYVGIHIVYDNAPTAEELTQELLPAETVTA